MGRRLFVRCGYIEQFKEQLMIRVSLVSMLVFLTGGVSQAGHCKSRAICAQVVQKQVLIKQVEPQVLYFVNPPQIAPAAQYQEVQEAGYGQIQREFQRLQDRMEELAALEQQSQQYYQPAPQYYPPPQPQWYPPQQQTQPCPNCEQSQQTQPEPQCDKCQKPPVESLPPQEAEPVETPAEEPKPPEKPPVFSQTAPMLQERCAGCHSGANTKGEFSIDGPMTWDKAKKIGAAIKHDRMPRDKGNNEVPLSDVEKEVLFRQLVDSL